MASFEAALQRTLLNEGGYVNDPDDPGGETYRGVARRIFSTWEGWPIVDAMKLQPGFPLSMDKNMDLQTKIRDFYRSNFWDRVQGDQIDNDHVAFSVFDFAVNTGVATSSTLAQHVVGVSPDGVIGPGTVNAINTMDPEFFLAAFTVAKVVRYVGIVHKRPTSQKYFFGWISRAINN